MAKIKGPLSEEGEDAMTGLLSQIMPSPEDQKRDELLAWSGGMTDPSGMGRIYGALSSGAKAQSSYRLEQDKIRAHYVPLIKSLLDAQQSQAQALPMGSLRGMPLETVYAYKVSTGKDLLPEWKVANDMETSAAGSYRNVFDAKTGKTALLYLGKPGEPALMQQPDGTWRAYLPEGTEQAVAGIAAAGEAGKGAGAAPYKTTRIIGPNQEVREVPMTTAFPSMGLLPPGLTGPSQGGQVPTPQPTQGALSMGQAGPPVGQAGPSMVPPMPPELQTPASRMLMAGIEQPVTQPAGGGDSGVIPPSVIPPVGVDHPAPIPKAQQAAMDKDAVGVLHTELARAEQVIANPASDPIAKQRAIVDAENIKKELGNKSVQIKAPPPVATAQAPASPGVQVELSPVQKMKIAAVEEGNKRWNATFNDLQQQRLRDEKEELNVNQISTAFKGMGQTGSIDTPLRKNVAEVLSFFGVAADRKYLESYEAAQQAIKDRVNAAIMADRGVATKDDATRHEQATASLVGKPGYNEYMLDVYRATIERNKRKLDFFSKAKSQVEDGDLERITNAWNQKAQKPLMDMPSMAKWKARYGWK